MAAMVRIDPLAMRTRIDDFAELMQVAAEALGKALNDGDAKHPVGSWREENAEELIDHAHVHMDKWLNRDMSEDQLAHAICDLVMARALKR